MDSVVRSSSRKQFMDVESERSFKIVGEGERGGMRKHARSTIISWTRAVRAQLDWYREWRQVAVWHEELKGWDNIDINNDGQSLSFQVMIGTIEGVAHGKMGGDGIFPPSMETLQCGAHRRFSKFLHSNSLPDDIYYMTHTFTNTLTISTNLWASLNICTFRIRMSHPLHP